eukprot:1342826-Amphidinium_carterae.2
MALAAISSCSAAVTAPEAEAVCSGWLVPSAGTRAGAAACCGATAWLCSALTSSGQPPAGC